MARLYIIPLTMGLKKTIGKARLKLGGWKMVNTYPDLGNAVCIVAPHTAIKDFFIGLAFYWAQGINFKVMMKIEFFQYCGGILSWPLKKLGAIPVNRGHQNHLVEQMVEMFSQNENTHLIICPEGPRKKVKHWKKGFTSSPTVRTSPLPWASSTIKRSSAHLRKSSILQAITKKTWPRFGITIGQGK